MTSRHDLDCLAADELAAAFGLGAMSPEEARAVEQHLATCTENHDEAHALIATASLVPAALEPVAPSPALRDRLMASVAVTPQDHRRVVEPQSPERVSERSIEHAPRRSWWQWSAVPSALAAVGLAAAVGLGAWNVSLNAQLAERDEALRAVASADVAFIAEGEAGRGWVIQTGQTAYFMADGLAELAAGELYELWLIDGAGTAVAAGVTTDTEGVALVALERPLDGATTFAVTVETERVERPSSAPVIVAPLGG